MSKKLNMNWKDCLGEWLGCSIVVVSVQGSNLQRKVLCFATGWWHIFVVSQSLALIFRNRFQHIQSQTFDCVFRFFLGPRDSYIDSTPWPYPLLQVCCINWVIGFTGLLQGNSGWVLCRSCERGLASKSHFWQVLCPLCHNSDDFPLHLSRSSTSSWGGHCGPGTACKS